MINKSQVYFHFLEHGFPLEDRTLLKDFIILLFKKERKRLLELHYIFCSDKYLLEINKQFLLHNYYTDIISFDLPESKKRGISGEIYISIDRIRDNSQNFDTSFKQELHRAIFHGALHLCG